MDSNRFDELSKELSNSTDRRQIVKGVGALAATGLALLALGRSASARNVNPRNPKVDKRCLTRCQQHTNRADCHRRCRRGNK